jgi:acyl dehydratase
MATTIDGIDGMRAAVGTHLGYSDWHEITQERVNEFAEATGDHQWIHVDPARAKDGPFGRTIAHGYLTLSLAPWLMGEVLNVTGMAMGLNYGLNKLRFPNPVPVGAKLRMGAALASVEDVGGGGVQAAIDLTFELEGETKPACVAQAVYRYYA